MWLGPIVANQEFKKFLEKQTPEMQQAYANRKEATEINVCPHCGGFVDMEGIETHEDDGTFFACSNYATDFDGWFQTTSCDANFICPHCGGISYYTWDSDSY